MEGEMTGEGVWVKAQFRKIAKASNTPRILTIRLSSEHNRDHLPGFTTDTKCVALCKHACLRSHPLSGGPYATADFTEIRFHNVLLAECRMLEESSRVSFASENVLKLKPAVFYNLYASDPFLTNGGFFDEEIVWMRPSRPFPLEKIVLTPSPNCSSEFCSTQSLEEIVESLFKCCGDAPIVFRQGFEFLSNSPQASQHYRPPSVTTIEEEFLGSSSSDSLPESLEDSDFLTIPRFDVLETKPLLQGMLTMKTRIIIIPPGMQRHRSVTSTGSVRDATVSPDDEEASDSLFTFPSLDRSVSLGPSPLRRCKLRTCSASELTVESFQVPADGSLYEDSSLPLISSLSDSASETLRIEAIPAPGIRLQYHFILLPKQQAMKCRIFNLQNVVVSGVSSAETETNSSDVVLSISNNIEKVHEFEVTQPFSRCQPGKKHIAIVWLYSNACELEKFVPQMALGRKYTPPELSLAYVHPELMFVLFPETLALKERTFFIEIENVLMTPSPLQLSTESGSLGDPSKNKHPLTSKSPRLSDNNKICTLTICIVHPADYKFDCAEVLNKYLSDEKNKLMVKEGDVFTLNTEYGPVVLRVLKVEPDTLEHGGIVDNCTLIYMHSKMPHSYITSVSSYEDHSNDPAGYWKEIRPPGLEKYCQQLFMSCLPIFTARKHIERCTVTLISGPPGVGKRTVVNAVAKQLRLSVFEVNFYEYCRESLGASEAQLKNVFAKAITHAPCLFVLNNLEMVVSSEQQQKDTSLFDLEPRFVDKMEAYMEQITQFAQEMNFVVGIVGLTSNLERVSPQIQQLFLHEIKMTPPNYTQRLQMLTAMGRGIPASPGLNLEDIAHKSAAFVLGDYSTLFEKAAQFARQDAFTYCFPDQNYGTETWIQSQDMAIAGEPIYADHMEMALKLLYTLHSDNLGAPKIPNVRWCDVGGMEKAKKEILETIQLPLLHPELFSGGLRRSGILLYGAPGTGKTLLAKAVATECSLNFLSVKGPEIINKYVGQSEENVRNVFARARSATPCVIFFDELDSIAPNRGKSGDSGGVIDRVVSQLLSELDGLDRADDLFVIGATNRPDLIDPALLRPGRFDRLVYLDVCDDAESKLTILKAQTRKFSFDEDVDLPSLAQQCPDNLTGADLFALCSDAMLTALRKQIVHLEKEGLTDDDWKGPLTVCQDDFLSSLAHLTPSVSEKELERYRQLQRSMKK